MSDGAQETNFEPLGHDPSEADFSLRRILVLTTVQLTTLLFGMAVTVANVVLPQIKGALSATQDEVAWVVTFNLVATAIVTPMTGWLTARFGWRNVMVGSVFGFVVSSIACGLAGTLSSLVAFRAVQGAFGAPLMPLGQAIIMASFPRRLHPLVMMLWGIGGVIGPVMGPIFGGLIAELLGWRWVFYMLVPFGIAALIVAWVALDDTERNSETKLEWTGFFALAVAVGSLQLVLSRGQRLDWFESPEILIESALAIAALYIFVMRTFTAASPLLDPRLFLNRNFSLGVLVAFVMGMLSYTPIVLFPPLLQELRGYPDSMVGYLLSARGVGNWLSFLIVVPFTRFSPRLALAVGLAAQGIAGLMMARLSINLTEMDVFLTNLLQGFGFGLAYTPMAVLAFMTLDTRLMTQGSSIFNLVRNFGSSVFISISVVVLVRTSAMNYDRMRESVSHFNEILLQPGVSGSWSIESLAGLHGVANEVQRQATMIGYTNAFYLFGLTALACVPLAALFKVRP